MIHTHFKLDYIDNIPATMTITATIGEWKLIQESLSQWPGTSVLASHIDDMIEVARKEYTESYERTGYDDKKAV
jgi:hypothetical protein